MQWMFEVLGHVHTKPEVLKPHIIHTHTNRPSVYTKPVNPHTETAPFLNCSLECFNLDAVHRKQPLPQGAFPWLWRWGGKRPWKLVVESVILIG